MNEQLTVILATAVPVILAIFIGGWGLSRQMGKWNGAVTTELKNLGKKVSSLETNCEKKMTRVHERIDDVLK